MELGPSRINSCLLDTIGKARMKQEVSDVWERKNKREKEKWSFYAIYGEVSKIVCSTFSIILPKEMIHVIECWIKNRDV